MKERAFIAKGVQSLSWRGDELVDWVGGGRAFALDGTESRGRVNYAYRFDAAITSADGRYAVIFEKLGTKGLLLDHGQIVRELDRSFYCAEAYEYPLAFLSGSDGRLLLLHCPESYHRLEIEDVESGEVLTKAEGRKPADFFHSRLSLSPQGKRLVSAGWIWHPWSQARVFDVTQALANPHHLDGISNLKPTPMFEVGSACWLDDDRVIAGGSASDENLDEQHAPGVEVLARGLAVYNVASGVCERAFQIADPPGTMYAVDETRLLSLYDHPKLIDLTTGAIIQEWAHLRSGRQDNSIIGHLKDDAIPPPMAYDPICKRLAIANGDDVTVLDFA